MKIKQLRINRFGHFTDRELSFSTGDFHVIYGPNEAGKTTLLEFVRGLLFDFPARTPYDFRGPGEIAGVATLEMKDGSLVELRRRKGTKDKVAIKLGGKPTDLVDADWIKMLDHADRLLFESVFAFGLTELSRGEASLAHESLRSALFGGGLGGTVSIDRVLDDLTAQIDQLFKKGGSKPAINVLLADLKKLKSDIKDHVLKPEMYCEAKQSAEEAANVVQTLNSSVAALRQEHGKLDRRSRAWKSWWEWRQLTKRRETLGTIPNIPADAGSRYRTLGNDLGSLDEDQAQCRAALERDEQSLAALRCDPKALTIRAEIKACVELRRSYLEAKEDQPERRRKREELIRQIDRELGDLRPGWNQDHLREFAVDHATRDAIERMSTARNERAAERTKLLGRHEQDVAELARAQGELAELGAIADVGELESVLANEAEFTANRKQAESLRIELAKVEQKLQQQTNKLTPPLPPGALAPHERPVPRPESISEFETAFADLMRQREADQATIAKDEIELQGKQATLETAMSNRIVPTRAELDAIRHWRDAGWELVRRKLIAGEAVDVDTAGWLDGNDNAVTERFRQAMQQADEIADRLYADANEVAKREGLQREITAIEQRLANKRLGLTELIARTTEWERKWGALWETCGFAPLAPDAMRSWLGDHQVVCALTAQRDELLVDCAAVDERLAKFAERLRTVQGAGEVEPNKLFAQARRAVEEAKDRENRRRELQRQIRRIETQRLGLDDKLSDLFARESAGLAEWQELLGRLKFPTDWSTELARDVILRLSATRVRLDGLPGENERITAMQARIDEFNSRVGLLCSSLAPALVGEPTETAIEKLHDQVERAVEAQRTSEELLRRLDETHEMQAKLKVRSGRLADERAELLNSTGATNETEFFDAVARADEARKLDAEIGLLRHSIDVIRAGEDTHLFEQDLADSELSTLESQRNELKDRVEAAEAERNESLRREALAQERFRGLNGSAEAALLTEELSRKRSRLMDDIDRFMPLVYARRILTDAVRRFEKENQPEMIATISKLFSRMTAGKYTEFDRSGGLQPTILVRQADGVEKTPEQLSTGTREQLYLAIRLAYVLDYCRRNQPLPIVIDDVLVNFDPERARNTLAALVDLSSTAQVLFFTCHPHMVKLAQSLMPGLVPIELTVTSVR